MHSNQFQVRQQRVWKGEETKREKGRRRRERTQQERMSSTDMEEGRRCKKYGLRGT